MESFTFFLSASLIASVLVCLPMGIYLAMLINMNRSRDGYLYWMRKDQAEIERLKDKIKELSGQE